MGLVRGKRPALSSTLLGFFTTNRGCIHSASLSAPVVAVLGSFAAVLCRTLFSSQSKGSSLLTGCQHLSIAPNLPLHLHCPNPPACTFLGFSFPWCWVSSCPHLNVSNTCHQAPQPPARLSLGDATSVYRWKLSPLCNCATYCFCVSATAPVGK